MDRIDLSDVPIVDAHAHPYRVEELLARGSEGFDTRITFAGESVQSSSKIGAEAWEHVDRLSDSTILALVLRRALAERLGCESTREAVTRARDAALRADPAGYVADLLRDAGVVAVLSDDGFPQPPIPREEFEAAIKTPVYRVARLEPWILTHREGTFEDLVEGVGSEVRRAAADPRCVAYKSIIAYRTGLDVGAPTSAEAAEAFARWRADGWRESREHAKPVRDFLLLHALAIAKETDRPFHIHCGAGDPDIDLPHARPADLWSLLVRHADQPIVLIHAGYPWIAESAYIASVLPHVYLELSELVPWGWSMVDWALEVILGTAPAAKVLHGSDEAGEPEAFWLAARRTRGALERVLTRFVEWEDLTVEEAERFGRLVLGENAVRLHGIDLGSSGSR